MRNFDEAGKYSSTITPVDGKPTSSSLVGNLKSDETDNSNATASCHEEKEVPRSIQKTCNGKVGKESSDYATNESPKNKSKIFDRVCEIEEKGKSSKTTLMTPLQSPSIIRRKINPMHIPAIIVITRRQQQYRKRRVVNSARTLVMTTMSSQEKYRKVKVVKSQRKLLSLQPAMLVTTESKISATSSETREEQKIIKGV